MRWFVSPLWRYPFRVHYIGYFSKRRWEPAKFDIRLLLVKMKYTSNGSKCLCALLDVSLSFHEQVLGRTFIFAQGEPSGFFLCLGVASCVGSINPPRPPNASVRQFKYIAFVKIRKRVFPEGSYLSVSWGEPEPTAFLLACRERFNAPWFQSCG